MRDIISAQDDIVKSEITSLATLSLSLGRQIDNWLIYAKSGIAAGKFNVKVSDQNINRNGVDTLNNVGGGSDYKVLWGFSLGAGTKYRISDAWSVGMQWQFVRLHGGNIDPGGIGCYNTGAGSPSCSAGYRQVKYEMEPKINLRLLDLSLNYHF